MEHNQLLYFQVILNHLLVSYVFLFLGGSLISWVFSLALKENWAPLDSHDGVPQFRHYNRSMTIVGGFNPVEKYSSNWMIFPGSSENKTYLKPPPR